MSFAPILPTGGITGWTFLKRTMERQQEIHAQSPMPAREVAHFKEKIATITTAEELVNDRTSLKVALGAFGLQDDLNNYAFVKKVLAEGTEAQDAFSNRLADKRYRAFAEAFGFGDARGPQTATAGFGDSIGQRYLQRDFEIAVGNTSESMRLALNMQRELPEIAGTSSSDTTKWLQVLGNPPLRQVIETALGLPTSFAGLDLDRQIDELDGLVSRRLGVESITDLAKPENLESLTRLYLARSDSGLQAVQSPVVSLFAGPASAQSILLTLAQRA